MTRDALRAAMSDQTALVATLVGEVLGEPVEGQIGVACVIRNRVRHPRWWGSGWKGVCHAPDQFSCWWQTGPNTDRVYATAEALMRRQVTGGAGSALAQLQWVAAGVLDDLLIDNVRRADHYVTTQLWQTKPPAWLRGRSPVAVRGNHTFFRLEI